MKCLQLNIGGIKYFVTVTDLFVTLKSISMNSDVIYNEPFEGDKHKFNMRDARKFINRSFEK